MVELPREVRTIMSSPASTLGFRDVLKSPAVKRLWIAQIVSIFGDFLAVFAVISVVTFQLHGTATQVSMILAAYMAPLAVISPLAGVYVDKWNVKWTMISSDLIRGVLVVALLFVRDLNAIYGIFFLLSAVSSFYIPAQSVAIRTLAPQGGLMSVNALMSQAMQGAQIISPAISGLMVQGLGANSCFIFDVLSFFFSAWMIGSLPIQRTSAAPPPASVLRSMGDGFRFIFTHSVISFVLIAMACGMFAVRCFGTLLSVYVRDVLRSNAALFGTLNSLIGFGMIAGTQSVRRFAARSTPQHMVIYGLAGMGASVFVTALFGMVWSTAAGMLAIGFFAAFVFVTSQTLIQQETPQEVLGRVSSSLMSLMAISQVLAMVVAGPVAQQAGIRNLYFGSAAMLFGISVTGFLWLRKPVPSAKAAGAS
jgi:MFS transporter, DHA3 family, macrolide efflux protein